MPDYGDMTPFARWWETKGWWLARRLNLDEAAVKTIWTEGHLDGISGSRKTVSNMWGDDQG